MLLPFFLLHLGTATVWAKAEVESCVSGKQICWDELKIYGWSVDEDPAPGTISVFCGDTFQTGRKDSICPCSLGPSTTLSLLSHNVKPNLKVSVCDRRGSFVSSPIPSILLSASKVSSGKNEINSIPIM